MANYVSNFILKLKSEGVKETADTSAQINKNMQSAAIAADKIASKMPKAYAASSYGGRGASSSQEAQEIREYGRARGALGGTGAASRDFANQAQGLGGLVRLYATFAANIFAASAAFRALSTAMDTTNMVKGLDQLGAATGRNLGTLSKNLAAASDGAVSLRDAMEATAKASSAGLSNTQILQMGDAARKASQALGIGMPDALSRISRGISKLEPELLDELGLFVKIDDATQAYARSIGKSVTSLTDFERRQAFANAVLDQAQQKFGNIEIDVNPYNKLLASFQNLLQSGLELVNKVLGPIVKLLAESPVALAGALGLVGITLLKQVSPVFTEWRQNLRNAAADAAETAKRIQESFGDEFQERLEARFRIPDLQKSIKATEAQLAKLQKGAKEIEAAPATLVKKAPTVASVEADDKSLALLEKLKTTRQGYIEQHIAGTKRKSATEIESAKTEISWLERKQAILQKEIEQNRIANELLQKRTRLDEAFSKAQAVADKPRGRFDPETIAIMETEKARRKYDQISAVSNAAETARILGITAAWGGLRKEVEEKNIKGFSKYSTLLQGGIASIGTRLVGIISSFSTWGMVIAAVTAGFEILNNLFSKNRKEAEEASKSLSRLEESAKFVDQVLQDISKRDPLAQLSTASIKAKAGAFQEIANAMQDTMKKVTMQVQNANIWDVFIDGMLASLTFGAKGLLADSSKQLSYSVSQAFKVMADGIKKDEAVQKFKEAFKVSPDDREALRKVLAESPEKFMELAPEVTEFMRKLGMEISNTASRADELTNAFSAAEKTLKDFVTSSLPTDPISKFGAELVTLGEKINFSLKDADTAVAGLVETLNSPTRLSLLGDVGKQLEANKQKFLEASQVVQAYKTALQNLDVQGKGIESKIQRTSDAKLDTSGLEAELAEINASKQVITNALKQHQQIVKEGTALYEKAGASALQRGTDYLKQGISITFAKAAITLSNAFAERMGNTLAGIERRAELEKETNNLQIAQLVAQKSMLDMQEAMQKTIALNTNATEINTLALQTKPGEKPTQEIEQARENLVKQRISILTNEQQKGQISLLDLARKNIDAQITQLKNANKAIDIRAFDQAATRRALVEKDIREVQKDQLATKRQELDLEIQGLPYLNSEQLARKKELEDGVLRLKQLDEQSNIQLEIARNVDSLTRSGISEKDRAATIKTIQELGQESIRLNQKQIEERKRAEISYAAFVRNNVLAEMSAREEAAKNIQDIEADIIALKMTGAIEAASLELELLEQTGKLSENLLITKKAELAVRKEIVALESRKRQLDDKYLKDIEKYEKIIQSSEDPEQRKEAKRQIQAILERYNFELAQEDDLTDKKIKNIDAIANYQKTGPLATSLTDAILLSLKEGGKQGGEALRDILEAELRKPFNVVVKAILDPITTQISGFINTLLSGQQIGGNIGSSMASSFSSSLAGTAVGNAFMGAAGTASSAFSSGLAISTQGAGFGTAMTSAGNLIGAGNVGAGIMQGIGAAMPYVAIAAAVYAIAKSLDDSGTPHMGGYTSVTPEGTVTDITAQQQGIQDKNMQNMISAFALGVSDLVNSTAKTFGDTGEYIVKAVFESDQNDPSWGIFELLKQSTGAQAAGFFAQGTLPSGVEEGFKEFSTMAVDSIIIALKELNLPEWAKKSLGKLPEDADFQALANVVAEINKVQASISALKDSLLPLGDVFTTIANLSSDSIFKLSELSGGFDNFNNNLRTYYDRFYTENEKAVMETNRITAILAKVGINEVPKTIQGFRDLIEEQLRLGTAGEAAVAALLSVSGALADLIENSGEAIDNSKIIALNIELLQAQGRVYEAVLLQRQEEEKSLSAAELAIKRKIWAQEDLNNSDEIHIRILSLTNNSQLALTLNRNKELLALKEIDRPMQRYIWALEDEATAKEKVKAAYDKLKSSLTSTVNNITNNINRLKDYREGLVTGPESILTPAQKYAQLKETARNVAAIATGAIAATDEERQKAIDQLPSVASSLLELSSTLFASSDVYTQDFNWVQQMLDGAITSQEGLLTDAQRQLNELELQTSALDFIKTNTETTATLLAEFNSAWSTYMSAVGNTAVAQAGYTSSREEQIRGLYQQYFGREADQSGLEFWTRSGYSTNQIIAEFLKSPEYLGRENQIRGLYQQYFGREADQSGLEFWTRSGYSVDQIIAEFLKSAEYIANINLAPTNTNTSTSTGDTRSDAGTQVPQVKSTTVFGAVAEAVVDLVAEVEGLREDINNQTGALIQSNYDANITNADMLIDENSRISTNTRWANRSAAYVR